MTKAEDHRHTPPAGPVQWAAFPSRFKRPGKEPTGKLPIFVVAQTWFAARQSAAAILGAEPGELIVQRVIE